MRNEATFPDQIPAPNGPLFIVVAGGAAPFLPLVSFRGPLAGRLTANKHVPLFRSERSVTPPLDTVPEWRRRLTKDQPASAWTDTQRILFAIIMNEQIISDQEISIGEEKGGCPVIYLKATTLWRSGKGSLFLLYPQRE